jgi:hypothetical protein
VYAIFLREVNIKEKSNGVRKKDPPIRAKKGRL